MKKLSKKEQSQLKVFEKEKYVKKGDSFEAIFKEHLPKQIILIAVLVILIIFIIINLNNIGSFINKVIGILMPVIIGWILTYLIAPLYDLVVNRIISDKSKHKKTLFFAKVVATTVCTLVVILIGVGLIFLFVPQLYISFTNFVSRMPHYIDNTLSTVQTLGDNAADQYSQRLYDSLETTLNDLVEKSGDFGNVDVSKLLGNIYQGFYFSLKMILNIFVGLIVMMYSLNLKDELVTGLKRILFAIARKDIAQKILVECRYANKVFSGFLVGKILDSLIIGIICYVGCFIMKMPYTPLISVIVGVTNIIPFFGPFIGAIPSFIIILLEETFTWRPWGFLLFVLALQQLDGNVIGPKILGDKTGVGSFWVLFSILLFGGLFGFVGMIIAVPLWAIITRLFEEFVVNKLKEKNYPLTTEDYQRLKEYNQSLKKGAK